jgi:hypothetical protein
MKSFKQHIACFLTTASLLSLLTGCGEHEEFAGGETRARFCIGVKGRGETMDPVADNEKICSWWIAMVGNDDNVVKSIIRRDEALTQGVEEETFQTSLPAGRYRAYAFANITEAELEEHTRGGGEKGVVFEYGRPLAADVDNAVWNGLANNYPKTNLVPMCGRRDVTVTGHVREPFAVEVVRMLAKMEFEFSSEASTPIKVKNVSISPVATGSLPLLPDYDALDKGAAPVFPEPEATEIVKYSINEDNGHMFAANAEGKHSEWFYLRESSAAAHPSGHFIVSVGLERDGKEEEALYAPASELSYVYRNDWVRIPIVLTDWVLELDVTFYPPIGGYPAVKTEEKDNEFYARFGTGGYFAIVPRVRNGGGGGYLPAEKLKVTLTVINDPSGIFDRVPEYDKAEGAVSGHMSVATGTAEIGLSVEVLNEASAKRIYERTVYIIRE